MRIPSCSPRRRGHPRRCCTREALGLLSGRCDASGVSGVHGKSTTTALCGAILKEWGFPATVLVGTEVPGFGGRSTLVQGDTVPRGRDLRIPAPLPQLPPRADRHHQRRARPPGLLQGPRGHPRAFEIVRQDRSRSRAPSSTAPTTPGPSAAAARIGARRDDLRLVPYGRSAAGAFRITAEEQGEGGRSFRLAGSRCALRAARSRASTGAERRGGARSCDQPLGEGARRATPSTSQAPQRRSRASRAAAGAREIVGEAGGVLFMDDYAHHPTAIEKTLAGITALLPRAAPGRRFHVAHLLADPGAARRVRQVLRPGRRGDPAPDLRLGARGGRRNGAGRGRCTARSRETIPTCEYFDEPLDACPWLKASLRAGDLFITMGAGDNWRLGRELCSALGGGRMTSMTGFGHGEHRDERVHMTLEMRSYNNRFLELSLNLPYGLQATGAAVPRVSRPRGSARQGRALPRRDRAGGATPRSTSTTRGCAPTLAALQELKRSRGPAAAGRRCRTSSAWRA